MSDWQLYALASAFFAGLTAIFVKMGVCDIPSNVAMWIRTIVIVFFLTLLITFRREWISPSAINHRNLIFLVLSAIATGLSWMCYFRALQTGPASLVGSIDKLSLVFTVLLAVLILHEHLSWWQLGGVALTVCGTLLIVLK